MRKQDGNRARFSFMLAVLLGIILVFGAVFFSYIQRFELTLKEENRSRLSEVSGYIGNYMEKVLSEQQKELGILASAVSSMEDREEQVRYLGEIAGELGYEYIGIAGEDGKLDASVFQEPVDIGRELYFKASMDGEAYISDITRQIFYDRAVDGITLSVPVPGRKNQIIAAMVSDSKLGGDVRMESFGKAGYSYIINAEGDLVVHARSMEYNNLFQSLQNVEFSPGYSLEAMKKDIRNHRDGMTEYRNFQIDKYAYYCPMNINGWTVVSTVPMGVITARTAVLSRNLIALCVISMLVFLALITWVYTMFLRMEGRKRENRAKSAFLANMSHDMRTPMNAIIGMTSIAGAHADEPDTVRDCLKKITLSSRHLLGLINDILDMAKIESGNIVLGYKKFSVAEVFEGAVNIVYPLMRDRHQQFSVRLHRIRHETFYGDELRLGQILINILTNAVKFTPDRGQITVDVEELLPKDERTAVLRFSFADNGIGIKPEFLKQIFSAFTREQDSKVDKIEGSGLGMAITKQIVDLMNGHIDVESEEGKGTVFHVTLPLPVCGEQEEGSDVTVCGEPQEGSAGLCSPVLLVGGGGEPGKELFHTLEEMGVKAQWAEDGPRAAELISKAEDGGYEAVLIDREILDRNEAAAVCRACKEGTVCILAAYNWDDIRGEAAAMGITRFVQKPLFCSVLEHALCTRRQDESGGGFTQPGIFDFRNRHILLAEDNELNMEIIQDILQETGAGTHCTKNGAECVQAFSRSPEGGFDMVLMDIQMPVMNGYEASRKIRSMDRTDSDIPIFAMSANAYSEDMDEAARAGMSGYLTKPINMQVWLKEIDRCLKS